MNKNEIAGWIVAIFAIILIVGAAVTSISIPYINTHTETVTVKEKTICVTAKPSNSYLIYTDNGVFKVQDLFFIGLFNASDVYNQLEIESTYNIEVSGIRFPFFSWYQNVRKVEKYEVPITD